MKKLQILFFSLIIFGLSSCGEDLLDINPAAALPPDAAIQTVQDMETVLTGVYSQLQNSDWYGRYFVLVPDVMSDDVKQNASANRAKEWAEYNGNQFDFIPEEIWAEVYEGILRSNTIINAEIDAPAAVQDDVNQFRGEAYAIRALAHFDLVRIYGQHYGFTADNSHPGVPIVTEFDQESEPTRATVQQVYDQVISDFNQALSLMNQNRGVGFFSPDAANALLARVYMYQSNYAQAEAKATEVINSANTSLTPADSYISTWLADGPSPDAIFDVIMLLTDNNGSDALGRMYINEGYGDYLPSQDLVSIIEARGTDSRIGLFKEDATLAGVFGPIRVNKFPSIDGADNTPVVRLAEMYMIRAEARARTGNESGAIEDLMTIRTRAWPDAPMVDATGDALLAEIEEEKRIELMYEGHRLWDLMRWGRDVVRTDCTAPVDVCTITYPNDRFVLPIPNPEINANPNIQQNAGY
jgi:tetratricopeptide (TPR) repeat protein